MTRTHALMLLADAVTFICWLMPAALSATGHLALGVAWMLGVLLSYLHRFLRERAVDSGPSSEEKQP